MTNVEFIEKQKELDLSNRALAEKLGASESAVSLWARGQRPIPDTVAILLTRLIEDKHKTINISLTLNELFSLSRLAESRGQTLEELVIGLMKKSIAQAPTPEKITTLPDPLARVAEDETPYHTGKGARPEGPKSKLA